VALLKSKVTMSIYKVCIERLNYLSHRLYSNAKEDTCYKEEDCSNPVKVDTFLAAYILVGRPEKIFENMGASEEELFHSAECVLKLFEEIISILDSGKQFRDLDRKITKSFSSALTQYYQQFEVWKIRDQEHLARRIKHALIALQQARQQHSSNEPLKSSDSAQLRAQIMISRLRGRLQRVAGKAELERLDQDHPEESNSTADASYF
jgi:hypothetical protein